MPSTGSSTLATAVRWSTGFMTTPRTVGLTPLRAPTGGAGFGSGLARRLLCFTSPITRRDTHNAPLHLAGAETQGGVRLRARPAVPMRPADLAICAPLPGFISMQE